MWTALLLFGAIALANGTPDVNELPRYNYQARGAAHGPPSGGYSHGPPSGGYSHSLATPRLPGEDSYYARKLTTPNPLKYLPPAQTCEPRTITSTRTDYRTNYQTVTHTHTQTVPGPVETRYSTQIRNIPTTIYDTRTIYQPTTYYDTQYVTQTETRTTTQIVPTTYTKTSYVTQTRNQIVTDTVTTTDIQVVPTTLTKTNTQYRTNTVTSTVILPTTVYDTVHDTATVISTQVERLTSTITATRTLPGETKTVTLPCAKYLPPPETKCAPCTQEGYQYKKPTIPFEFPVRNGGDYELAGSENEPHF